MENVTPHNEANPANDLMPVLVENNPATAASPTPLTENPTPTETPALLKTPTTEPLADESAPFRTGWVAFVIRIASASGLWAFKKIKTLVTFGTLWKIFIVYQIVMFAAGFFGFSFASRDDSSNASSIQHPPVVQHFMFEPVGYSYASSSHPVPLVTGSPPQSSLGSNVRGYYEKDAQALRDAIRVVPVYSNLRKIPPCTDDTLNVTNGNLRTCPVTFLEEENETAAEACLPDDEGSSGDATANETMQNFNTTQEEKSGAVSPGTVIVFDFRHGRDPFLVGVTSFVRKAVTFLLGQIRDREFYQTEAARKGNATCIVYPEPRRFEVIVILESNGGMVSKYGLLAEQLRRLRNEPGVTLTVCCDESALSGGYMLAALASPGQLLAAPFASVGSIGVISSETLNFHHVFERLGVKSFRFQGGEAKAEISWLGEVGEDQMKRTQAKVDAIHEAFREHVRMLRGDLIQDFDAITNGNYWMGTSALKLGLVDRLITSDEYIDERVRAGDRVLKLVKCKKDGWAETWLKGLGVGSDKKFQGSSWLSILGSEAVDGKMSIAQGSLLEVFEVLYIGVLMVVAKIVDRV